MHILLSQPTGSAMPLQRSTVSVVVLVLAALPVVGVTDVVLDVLVLVDTDVSSLVWDVLVATCEVTDEVVIVDAVVDDVLQPPHVAGHVAEISATAQFPIQKCSPHKGSSNCPLHRTAVTSVVALEVDVESDVDDSVAVVCDESVVFVMDVVSVSVVVDVRVWDNNVTDVVVRVAVVGVVIVTISVVVDVEVWDNEVVVEVAVVVEDIVPVAVVVVMDVVSVLVVMDVWVWDIDVDVKVAVVVVSIVAVSVVVDVEVWDNEVVVEVVVVVEDIVTVAVVVVVDVEVWDNDVDVNMTIVEVLMLPPPQPQHAVSAVYPSFSSVPNWQRFSDAYASQLSPVESTHWSPLASVKSRHNHVLDVVSVVVLCVFVDVDIVEVESEIVELDTVDVWDTVDLVDDEVNDVVPVVELDNVDVSVLELTVSELEVDDMDVDECVVAVFVDELDVVERVDWVVVEDVSVEDVSVDDVIDEVVVVDVSPSKLKQSHATLSLVVSGTMSKWTSQLAFIASYSIAVHLEFLSQRSVQNASDTSK